MEEKIILLVEDNPDDELLAQRALKKNNITNKVVVARDGAQALDYLFGDGTWTGHETSLPQVSGSADLDHQAGHPFRLCNWLCH